MILVGTTTETVLRTLPGVCVSVDSFWRLVLFQRQDGLPWRSADNAAHELIVTGNSGLLSQIIRRLVVPPNVGLREQEGHGAETLTHVITALSDNKDI